MAKDNKEIGRFDLADIPPAPRGMPQIEVAFDIDADGILHVSAKDVATGKVQKIRIEAVSGLNEEEIKRAIRDAEEHAEEDRKRKEEIEVRNEAESLSFRAKKALDEYKDKIPADVAVDVQSKIDAVKKALEGQNPSEIRKAKEELGSTCSILGRQSPKQVVAQRVNLEQVQELALVRDLELVQEPALVQVLVMLDLAMHTRQKSQKSSKMPMLKSSMEIRSNVCLIASVRCMMKQAPRKGCLLFY